MNDTEVFASNSLAILRILAYANILTPTYFVAQGPSLMRCEFEKSSGRPVRAVDAGCQHCVCPALIPPLPLILLRLSRILRVLLSYRASSVLFPLGINASPASLSKNDFSRFLQSHADSDFDLTSTQHVSDIQRYGVLFLFSRRWGQHEGKPFRLNRVDLKCT